MYHHRDPMFIAGCGMLLLIQHRLQGLTACCTVHRWQVAPQSQPLSRLLGLWDQVARLLVPKLNLVPHHVDVQQLPDILSLVVAWQQGGREAARWSLP